MGRRVEGKLRCKIENNVKGNAEDNDDIQNTPMIWQRKISKSIAKESKV